MLTHLPIVSRSSQVSQTINAPVSGSVAGLGFSVTISVCGSMLRFRTLRVCPNFIYIIYFTGTIPMLLNPLLMILKVVVGLEGSPRRGSTKRKRKRK